MQQEQVSANGTTRFADLSIIVPTLNERDAVPLLLSRLAEDYAGATVIIADDDSTDGTRDVAEAFDGPLNVRVLHRNGGSVKGLSASVADALRVVETPHFVVMDADLQHPPEAVANMYVHASNGADLAVGRRVDYTAFGVHRRVLSRGARALTRGYLKSQGKPLVDDPMSGFFGGKTRVARAILEEHEPRFEKTGFKVLVDLLRFAPNGTKVHDVPYHFQARAAGESKLRARHMIALLRQLGPLGRVGATILESGLSPTFWKFALVGASGVLVNQAALFLLHGLLALPLLFASAVAIEGAIGWNFLWNDKWTFAGKGRGIRWTHRFTRFNVHCLGGAALNASVLWALVHLAGWHYLVGNLVGVGVAMAVNWGLSRAWTWKDQLDAPRA